jgi:2-dehydropantoate 2-reductase
MVRAPGWAGSGSFQERRFSMRIAILGVGAVGGYFGGRLARAGHDVTFIARGENLQAMRAHGLRVDSPQGDFVVHPVEATSDPAEVGPVDAVILGVKAWQVRDAARQARPLLGPQTMVLPLQNGVEAAEQAAAELGAGHVLGGVCRIMSHKERPGHIRHLGADPSIAFGELDNRPSERVRRLQEAFAQAEGVSAEVAADIGAAIWGKFMLMAPWGGVGSVTRAPAGVFRRIPESRALLRQCLEEVDRLARARGVGLAEDAVAATLDVIDRLPPQATASLQRDIGAGRPSELNDQIGAVVRLGRASGVATPAHAFLLGSLLPQERRARGEIDFAVL